jgi:hypothetical protein
MSQRIIYESAEKVLPVIASKAKQSPFEIASSLALLAKTLRFSAVSIGLSYFFFVVSFFTGLAVLVALSGL